MKSSCYACSSEATRACTKCGKLCCDEHFRRFSRVCKGCGELQAIGCVVGPLIMLIFILVFLTQIGFFARPDFNRDIGSFRSAQQKESISKEHANDGVELWDYAVNGTTDQKQEALSKLSRNPDLLDEALCPLVSSWDSENSRLMRILAEAQVAANPSVKSKEKKANGKTTEVSASSGESEKLQTILSLVQKHPEIGEATLGLLEETLSVSLELSRAGRPVDRTLVRTLKTLLIVPDKKFACSVLVRFLQQPEGRRFRALLTQEMVPAFQSSGVLTPHWQNIYQVVFAELDQDNPPALTSDYSGMCAWLVLSEDTFDDKSLREKKQKLHRVIEKHVDAWKAEVAAKEAMAPAETIQQTNRRRRRRGYTTYTTTETNPDFVDHQAELDSLKQTLENYRKIVTLNVN